MILGSSLLAAAAVSVAMSAAPVAALTLVSGSGDTAIYKSGFANIPGGDTVGDGVFSRYEFTIQKDGSNVLFKIFNLAATGNLSRIAEVYFDDSGLLTYSGGVNTGNIGTVSFTGLGANPPNLPQGNNIGFNQDFSFDATSNANGINAGEALGIRFGLQSGKTFQNVVDALDLHTLRLGIHVRDAVGGNSDAYATIPTPALLPGLIGLGIGAIRKRQRQQAEESDA